MKYKGALKRVFDVAVAGTGALAVFVPMSLLAAFNAAYFRENPFYFDRRHGKDQKLFNIIKLKTMRTLYDEEGNPLPEQDRVTRYGHFLRYTAVDEIPQLLNVLKGDMSLVGPRPNFYRSTVLSESEANDIYAVRPGMTGPWQVSVIGTTDVMPEEERIKYEASYVRDGITFIKDIKLLLRTPKTMVMGHDGLSLNHEKPWLHNNNAVS